MKMNFHLIVNLRTKKTKKFEPKSNQDILVEGGAEIVWKKYSDYYHVFIYQLFNGKLIFTNHQKRITISLVPLMKYSKHLQLINFMQFMELT